MADSSLIGIDHIVCTIFITYQIERPDLTARSDFNLKVLISHIIAAVIQFFDQDISLTQFIITGLFRFINLDVSDLHAGIPVPAALHSD